MNSKAQPVLQVKRCADPSKVNLGCTIANDITLDAKELAGKLTKRQSPTKSDLKTQT